MKNNRGTALALAAGLAALSALPARAADPNLARNLAATCANCHGTNGKSQGGIEPLAGLEKDRMLTKLRDFRSGAKPATIMHQIAKGYSDEQLDLIAGWFAAQK